MCTRGDLPLYPHENALSCCVRAHRQTLIYYAEQKQPVYVTVTRDSVSRVQRDAHKVTVYLFSTPHLRIHTRQRDPRVHIGCRMALPRHIARITNIVRITLRNIEIDK